MKPTQSNDTDKEVTPPCVDNFKSVPVGASDFKAAVRVSTPKTPPSVHLSVRESVSMSLIITDDLTCTETECDVSNL